MSNQSHKNKLEPINGDDYLHHFSCEFPAEREGSTMRRRRVAACSVPPVGTVTVKRRDSVLRLLTAQLPAPITSMATTGAIVAATVGSLLSMDIGWEWICCTRRTH